MAKNRVKSLQKDQAALLRTARGPPWWAAFWMPKYTRTGGVSVPLVYYVSDLEKNGTLDAERLLRLLGLSGKLSGFYYAVYMLEQVREKPECILLITKRLYRQTAQFFRTSSGCVERNLRTLVQACWRQPDHGLLERIAGHPLSQPPTNTQFIDMLAAYLRSSA